MKKCFCLCIMVILVSTRAVPVLAQIVQNGYIGVFSDLTASSCCVRAEPGVPTIAYVFASLSGATAQGISGVEFRLVFSPASAQSGYLITWTTDPAASLTLGTPIDPTPATADDPYGETSPGLRAKARRPGKAFFSEP